MTNELTPISSEHENQIFMTNEIIDDDDDDDKKRISVV